MRLLMADYCYKQIAFELGISPGTIKKVVYRMRVKYQVHTTVGLVCLILEREIPLD